METYRNPDGRECHSALETLAKKGVLPLAFPSKAFFDMNRLAAWILWSGYISVRGHEIDSTTQGEKPESLKAPHYRCGIHVSDDLCQRDLEKISTEYDIEFRENGSPNTMLFRKGGAPYVRLLSFLIPHVSLSRGEQYDRKARVGLTLPKHVLWILEKKEHASTQKEAYRQALGDFGTVLLHAKADSYLEKITLPQQSTEHNAQHLAWQVVNFLNGTYGTTFNSTNFRIGTYDNHNAKYRGEKIYVPIVKIDNELREKLAIAGVIRQRKRRWVFSE